MDDLICHISKIEKKESFSIKNTLPWWKQVACIIFGIKPQRYKHQNLTVISDREILMGSVLSTRKAYSWLVTGVRISQDYMDEWEVELTTVEAIPIDTVMIISFDQEIKP